MMAENKKLVIMARFVPEMNDIQEMLEKKGIGYAAVRGGVKDRAEEIRRFQEDSDCMVFIYWTDCGSRVRNNVDGCIYDGVLFDGL